LPDYLPASGISLVGQCIRCNELLQVLAEDSDEAQTIVWSLADEDMAEKLDYLRRSRRRWWEFWRRA
jgi:hypothetical protein